MKRFIAIIFLSFAAANMFAQDSLRNILIGICPQYMIVNGMRLEIDVKTNQNKWINISPTIYYKTIDSLDEDNSVNEEFSKLIGLGLELNRRIFLQPQKKSSGEYFSYGIMYQYFNVEFKDENYNRQKEKIFRGGFHFNIGYQYIFREFIIIDCYFGMGFRLSNIRARGSQKREFSDNLYDTAYSGPMLNGGLRFGIFLPKKIK